MNIFGCGFLFATPVQDAFGNTVSNPTPVVLGIMQEMDLGLERKLVELYGSRQFAEDIAGASTSVKGKVKNAAIYARALDTLYFGQGLVTGLIANMGDTVGAIIPATPYQITPTAPGSGTWAQDLGVISGTGLPYQRVASSPATGQYAVSAGVYTFAAADAAKRVYISYEYTTNTPATAYHQNVANLAMGATPRFGINFTVSYNGKSMTFNMPNCVSGKLGMNFKNEAFNIPELDFMAQYDGAAGYAIQWSTSE